MNKFIEKSISFYLSLVLTFSLFSFGVAKVSAQEPVTERELLMLATMSYSNNQKENVSDMVEDEKFNKKLFQGCTDASELVGWKTVDTDISKGNDIQGGFSAVCYKKENNLVVAFRGTDDGIIAENWRFFIPYKEHPQVEPLKEYIQKLRTADFINSETNIYCTGHSLGGYLTLYGTGLILEDDYLKNKFVKSATFNGLGLRYVKDDNIVKILSSLDSDKLVNYRILGDWVSCIGEHFTKMKTCVFINNNDKKRSSNPHYLCNFFLCSEFECK